jgi:hypothetical protein
LKSFTKVCRRHLRKSSQDVNTFVDLSPADPYNPWDAVKILMIAPEPFFEPRGTPFSEYHRIRALIDLGHTVDLVTYPFGRDVSFDARARR